MTFREVAMGSTTTLDRSVVTRYRFFVVVLFAVKIPVRELYFGNY